MPISAWAMDAACIIRAISITNTLNDLEDSVNNLTESVIANATGNYGNADVFFNWLIRPCITY